MAGEKDRPPKKSESDGCASLMVKWLLWRRDGDGASMMQMSRRSEASSLFDSISIL
jgi:hypothetical protein